MDNDESHCIKVSERKAAYDSRMATQNALLDLGKSLANREKNQQSREEKHAYLMSAIKDLDDFDGNVFMTEYERSKDRNLLKAKAYSLVRYIAIFKELHNSTVADLTDLAEKVSNLSEEVSDQSEQIDAYITQLDEADEAVVSKTNALVKVRKELKTLRSEVEIRDAQHRRKLSADKCRNIGNKALIWSLIIAQISSLVYMHNL